MMKFTLIIPCYNEEKSLPILIKKCIILSERKDLEIIFVDNGSTDNTYNFLKSILVNNSSFKVLKIKKNIGYGHGIISGINLSSNDIVGWTHADLQTEPTDTLKAIDFFLNEGKDIFVKGLRKKRKLSDNLFTLGMSFFESILLCRFLWDINAQPTFVSKAFFKSLPNPPTDFSLDLYVYYFAKIRGLRVFRFPVFFKPRKFGISSWNIDFRHKLKFIQRTIKFSLKLKEARTKWK